MTEKEMYINSLKNADMDSVLDKVALSALINSDNHNNDLIERASNRLASDIGSIKFYQNKLREIEEAEEKAKLEEVVEANKKKEEAKKKLGLK